MNDASNALDLEGGPHVDTSFSFYTMDSSPMATPKLDSPFKLSVIASDDHHMDRSPSQFSRNKGKSSTTMNPARGSRAFLGSPRLSGMVMLGDELASPSSQRSKTTRRSMMQEKGSVRSSKILRVLPVCNIGEEKLPVEKQEEEEIQVKIPQVREKPRDLNKMTSEELLDLAVRILKKDPEKRSIRDIQALSRCVMPVDFFKDCDKETTLKCLRHMSYESFRTNQTVFEINTIGTTFWVILRGSVGVWVYVNKVVGINEQGENVMGDVLTEVRTLPAGSSFGELALLENKKKRSAAIVCKEDCEFAVLEKSHFVAILKEKETKKLYGEVDFLVSLPLFKTWSYNAVKSLYYYSTVQKYKRGHVFYEEGDAPAKMYIVRSGELKVLKQFNAIKEEKKTKESLDKLKIPGSKKTIEMGIIGEKGIIGEEELLLNCPRKYKLVCHSLEVEVCEINKSVFLERVLKFAHTKEWLTNYVKTRENYYESRVKGIQINNSSLAHLASPRLSFSHKDSKDTTHSIKTTLTSESTAESNPSIKQIPSNFLRTMPKKSTRKITPECRVSHTEPDTSRNEDSGLVSKVGVALRHLAINDTYNPDKEQQVNQKTFMDQLDLKIYDTPTRRQAFSRAISRKPSKGLQNKKSGENQEEEGQGSFRDEVEKIKKKIIAAMPNSARKETERDKSLFSLGKKDQQSVRTTVPTEESLQTLTFLQAGKDYRQSAYRDSKGTEFDYGLMDVEDMKPATARSKLAKGIDKVPKGYFQMNSWGSVRDANIVFYNQTITESSDGNLTARSINDREFRPSSEHVFVKRMKQVGAMKPNLMRNKQRENNELFVKGFTASLGEADNVGFVQTERAINNKMRPYLNKMKDRNISTSVEGKRAAKSIFASPSQAHRSVVPWKKAGTVGIYS